MTSVTIDLNKPELQTESLRLLISLGITRPDIGEAIAVLVLALSETFGLVLHSISPMPEVNIQSLHTVVDFLKETIVEHEDCAKHNSEHAPNGTVN